MRWVFLAGSCDCYTGWGSADCSVDVTVPPSATSIENDGLCNLATGNACLLFTVYGSDFLNTDPKCQFQEVTVSRTVMMTSSSGNIFPRYWPFVRGIHRSLVISPHKGRWRGALMFSLICSWIKGWANNCEAGDLRRHRAHYDDTVMTRLNVQYPKRTLAYCIRDVNPSLQNEYQNNFQVAVMQIFKMFSFKHCRLFSYRFIVLEISSYI